MIMEKAILYKEWIKTRGYCLLALIVSCGMVAYCLMKMRYVIEMKGVEHLWQVMMERDAIFVDRLTYLPVVVGVLLAIVQFVPEMQQKRMKLMLHLPYPRFLNISIMLLYGVGCLITCFALHFAGIWLYTRTFCHPSFTAACCSLRCRGIWPASRPICWERGAYWNLPGKAVLPMWR